MPIKSFDCKLTEQLFTANELTERLLPKQIESKALSRLHMLDVANSLQELANYPALRFHALKNDLTGFFSITINRKFPHRIIFRWEDGNAYNVKILDYH